MKIRARDWRTLVLVLGAAAGALIAIGAAFSMVSIHLLQTILRPQTTNGATFGDILPLASALVLVGVVLLPSVFFGVGRLMGKGAGVRSSRPLRIPEGLLGVFLWLGASVIAQWIFDSGRWAWLTPPFYLLAISLPVYLLLRLASGGLDAGSSGRYWGILSTGMLVGTSIAVVVEVGLGVLGLLGLGVYVGFHPELMATLRQIAGQLSNAGSLDELLTESGPWLTNPWVLLIGLFLFSGLAPLIEESCKSIASWLVFDHLRTPSQGFVTGALSGAGFGLLESLLASATPDPGWASTLIVRGGSTMMHIVTASITGWGIATFRTHKRFRSLVGAYLLAMFLHGLWNACVVMIAGGSVQMMTQSAAQDPFGFLMISLGTSILVIMCIVIPVSLGWANWIFRTQDSAASLPPAIPVESSFPEPLQGPEERF